VRSGASGAVDGDGIGRTPQSPRERPRGAKDLPLGGRGRLLAAGSESIVFAVVGAAGVKILRAKSVSAPARRRRGRAATRPARVHLRHCGAARGGCAGSCVMCAPDRIDTRTAAAASWIHRLDDLSGRFRVEALVDDLHDGVAGSARATLGNAIVPVETDPWNDHRVFASPGRQVMDV